MDNVLEDVYIEGRICEAYPGTFARGIQLNNLRFAETVPTVASQVENGHLGYAIITNLMIQYCKTGDVNNLTRENSEYLDVLVDCLPILDAAMYDDDGRARYAAVNRLLIHLWPYLKELREKAQKELEGGEPGKDLLDALDKILDDQLVSSSGTPAGKGKPVADKGDGPIDAETLKELRKKARDVLEEEGGRIALTETESIDTGEGGVITENPTYAGAGYDKAAAAIGEDKDSIERIYGDGFLDISNLDDLPVSLTRLIAQRIRRR